MARTKKEEKVETKKQNKIDLTKIKEELTDYVNKEIRKNFAEEVEKAHKRVLREKNKKILTRNIIILILLALVGFLLYLLYSTDYFDKFFYNNKMTSSKVETSTTTTTNEPTLDELKNKYSYLLEEITINENSKYLDNYYKGDLNNELKCYLTINSMDFSNISTEEDYSIIKEDAFMISYNKIFNDNYTSSNFEYDGNKITYISSLSSYVATNKLAKGKSNIVREITNVDVSKEEVVITTIEGLIKDDKVYSITSNEELGPYNQNLTKYNDNLNKVIYTFKDNKLIGLK